MSSAPIGRSGLPAQGSAGNLRFFRLWAAVLFVTSIALGPLVVFAFGAISFTALSFLWMREPRKADQGALDLMNGIVLVISALWFLLNLAIEILPMHRSGYGIELYAPLLMLAFVYPPLVMHISYLEEKPHLVSNRGWMVPIAVSYFVSAGLVGVIGLAGFGVIPGGLGRSMAGIQSSMFVLFCAMVIFVILVSIKSRKPVQPNERSYRKWTLVLLTVVMLMLIVFLLMLLSWSDALLRNLDVIQQLSLVFRSLPLCFFFLGTYYQKRFAFFDIFIKRGTFFFLLMLLLAGYFAVALPVLGRFTNLGGSAPWVYALTLLPLLLVLPWCYQKLESWLDRAWLGRSFATVEAVKYFISGVQSATGEDELRKKGEERLSAIFQADVSIRLLDGREAGAESFEIVHEAPVRIHGEQAAVIRMGRRANDTPYFSADAALLASLADVFSSLLESARLQQKKQQQERREQELMLQTSRSELKALRAQVNPHFLFNALNAIAGLIHRDPARAEATIEELSEVFRYTLKRSEKETVRLEEELEFVRSYLEVEHARFGDRLEVRMKVDPGVKQHMIPTMMIQTLVENAVKHGIAAVRGPALLEIHAGRRGERLCIEVLDNGPGFPLAKTPAVTPEEGSGYGLRNVIERLRALHGSSAELEIRRDDARRMTVVSIEMPVSVLTSSEEIDKS